MKVNQKAKIKDLLNAKGEMTQKELARAIYNDDEHLRNIYNALKDLMKRNIISRTNTYPCKYYLTGKGTLIPAKAQPSRVNSSNVSITNEAIEEVCRKVNNSNYGPEWVMIQECLQRFPNNTDPNIVAMKMGLIDITNSTRLSQYKELINIAEFSRIIASIPNIDKRLANGDPELVNEIAKSNGKINLFSFATKYCCYHNIYIYERDDYSILDGVVKETLPVYFEDITKNQINKWQNMRNYESFNDYITTKLDELGITLDYRRRKFDIFVWWNNRKNYKELP